MSKVSARERRAAVRRATAAYAEQRPALVEATSRFVELVTALLDDARINYLSVTGRTKGVESYRGKVQRLLRTEPYTDPDALIANRITDQIGVRVITYVTADVDAVANLLSQELALLEDRDLGLETARAGRFGYSSRHLRLGLDASRSLPPAFEPLRRLSASVQIRTVLQHAWAEFEHDIRYKGTVPEEYASDLDRRFTLAAGLLELADREFSAIRDRLQVALPAEPAEEDETDELGEAGDAGETGDAGDAGDAAGEGHGTGHGAGATPAPHIGAQDLAKSLAATFTDAGWSRTDHYEWISGLLAELGIGTVDELEGVLAPVESAPVSQLMGYSYPPGAVRRLDDALLWIYGERYLALTGNAHRRAALAARLAKLRPAPH